METAAAKATALGNLGTAYADLGDAHKAIEFHEQHLGISREIGDRRGEGNALGNLGIAYKNLGDTHKALEFYEQQLVIMNVKSETAAAKGLLSAIWELPMLIWETHTKPLSSMNNNDH